MTWRDVPWWHDRKRSFWFASGRTCQGLLITQSNFNWVITRLHSWRLLKLTIIQLSNGSLKEGGEGGVGSKPRHSCTRLLPVSQWDPLNPVWQVQLYPLRRSLQDPPFLQGLLAHSSTSADKHCSRYYTAQIGKGRKAPLKRPTCRRLTVY